MNAELSLHHPRRLERGDDRSGFRSGATELDEWFVRFAWENQAAHNAVTYVAPLSDGTFAGCYSLCSAAVSRDVVPPRFGTRRPTDIPCILLARLAVREDLHGRRIGRHLLLDAVRRAVAASQAVGAAALLIHARDDRAKGFYQAHLDVLQSPVDGLQLLVPMKVLGSTLITRK